MDEEFGVVQHALIEKERVTDQDLEINVNINALSSKQMKELLDLIKKYRTVFDGKLRKAKMRSHMIFLKTSREQK